MKNNKMVNVRELTEAEKRLSEAQHRMMGIDKILSISRDCSSLPDAEGKRVWAKDAVKEIADEVSDLLGQVVDAMEGEDG